MVKRLIYLLDNGIEVMAILFMALAFFSGIAIGMLWSDENAKEFMLEEHKCPYELKTEYEIIRRF